MAKTIRIIFISVIMSLAIITSSPAGTILYGTVTRLSGLLDNHNADFFPFLTYKFNPDAYDLKYDKHIPVKDRVKHLYWFALPLEATLDLVCFDRKTYVTKFKLTLFERNWLRYTGPFFFAGVYFETGGTDLKGCGLLKLDDGSEPTFIIEGKLEMINGKAKWISFHRNKYFDLDISYFNNPVTKQSYYLVELKLLQDLPVIVAT